MSPGSSACFGVTQSPPMSLRSDIQSLSCIFFSRAFFQSSIQISVWFVLEVGPAFGRGLDSVHPSERTQPQLRSRLQYHHGSQRQYLRSLKDFVDIRHGWDPGPHRLCLKGELGGPGPPRGPAGESSSSRPQPSPVTSAAEATSSPQLSPASRIKRSLLVGNPIPGNVRLHCRPFHQESHYDVPALRADPRFRESMRLIEDYSLLAFMTPRQHYYPRVVLQFYQSMTSRGADGPRELQFSIDDRRGVLKAADISAALGLRIPPANVEGYRDWAHPPHREMV